MNFHHIKLAVYIPWDVFNMYLIQECPFTAAKNNDDGVSVRTQSSQSISQTRIQLQLHLLDLIRTSSPWRFHLCSNCSTKALQSHNATTRCLWRWEFCKPKVLLDIFFKTMDDRWPKIDTICWTVWKRSILHVQKPTDWPSSIHLQKIHRTF